MIFIH